MAQWFHVSLQWSEGPPTDQALEELNRFVKTVDYDFPQINLFGVKSQLWRDPTVSIQEVIDLLHMLGHPCIGKVTPENASGHEHATWVLSKARPHASFNYLLRSNRTRFEHLDDDE